MITASELAGFFAAHAIWCVADGATLIPMLAYTTKPDEWKMERLTVDDDLEACVAYGQKELQENPMDANDAALLYDVRLPVGGENLDAIIVEIRTYFSLGSEAVVAVPYTPKSSGSFRVHKPKLLRWTNCDDFDVNVFLQSFFHGVGRHEQGAKIWNECLDESK